MKKLTLGLVALLVSALGLGLGAAPAEAAAPKPTVKITALAYVSSPVRVSVVAPKGHQLVKSSYVLRTAKGKKVGKVRPKAGRYKATATVKFRSVTTSFKRVQDGTSYFSGRLVGNVPCYVDEVTDSEIGFGYGTCHDPTGVYPPESDVFLSIDGTLLGQPLAYLGQVYYQSSHFFMGFYVPAFKNVPVTTYGPVRTYTKSAWVRVRTLS